MFGRIGNFINGELFGKPSNVPWAMIFPQGGNIPDNPSKHYEAFLKVYLLFIICGSIKTTKKKGDVFAAFLILYGIFRIVCEIFRYQTYRCGYIWIPQHGQALSVA